MDLIIYPVPDLNSPLLEKVHGLLATAVEASHDDVSVGYVVNEIVAGNAILWIISTEESRGVVVTTVIDQGQGQALLIWLIAGEAIAQYSQQIQKRLEQFAKEIGCQEIKAVVSNKKLENHMLANLGYQYGGAVLYKEVNHERIVSRSKKLN